MKALIAGIALVVIAIIGITTQSHPYRLDRVGQPTDQAALAHRDSAYASSTWVASRAENFLQLRFFDRVEGGVCLRPSWDDLQAIGKKDASLSHLIPATPVEAAAPGAMWPNTWQPNPGTVPNTRYVCLFPSAVLLIDRLATAGATVRDAPANIAVVGLGSGIGLAVYAHHFPQSSITVIDIDPSVIELVREYYPLLRWLETQKTADGRPRLTMVHLDARQYLQMHGEDGSTPFDVIVLDAYTSGSTIPPHLMTKEFYAECAAVLSPDGILMSNIISSYLPPHPGSTKNLVIGGAMRSMEAAGLTNTLNIPILRGPGSFKNSELRNNILLASKLPLTARERPAAWDRCRDFVPYPELAKGQPEYTTRTVSLSDGQDFTSSAVPADEELNLAVPGLRGKLRADTATIFGTRYDTQDPVIIKQVIEAVRQSYISAKKKIPAGWDTEVGKSLLLYVEIDWVNHARMVWETSIAEARKPNMHDGGTLIGSDGLPGVIKGAPLFTDARPNADIYNTGD